ncbi:MAG: Gfo/Idh/MocA family oxidoreductase [Candidatus Handelsmanbacteria bacterium]|nr:Gfo/Idh/MocA family oxidoreductase [Candidatus Handelsmanbacteria bacterium]
MAQPPLRAVIVGLTGIGAARPASDPSQPIYHPTPPSHAAAYQHHPRTELVAVCDLRTAALEDFRQTWQDVWPNLHYYTDYALMLREQQPELVSIATSDHAHADVCVAATQSGARAILCEKPIATTLADADRMIGATAERGVLLSVEHTRRWDPLYLRVRQLLHSGELGPLRTMTAELFSPRAMLFRNGTHLIDLFSFFGEADPLWVVADLEDGFEDYRAYKGDGGRNPDLEPYASAYIRFAGGIRGFYNSYKAAYPGSGFSLVCEEGVVRMTDQGAQVSVGRSFTELWTRDLVPGTFLHTRQLGALAELVHVLEKGGTLISPGPEARKALALTLAMLESHCRGNIRVDLPQP